MSGELLADLTRAALTPAGLAARHNLSLRELAAWFAEPDTRAALNAVCALADAQASLVISRARARAARRLLRIAANPESPETARKACVDLLNLPTGAPQRDDEFSANPHDAVRAVLGALDALAAG